MSERRRTEEVSVTSADGRQGSDEVKYGKGERERVWTERKGSKQNLLDKEITCHKEF